LCILFAHSLLGEVSRRTAWVRAFCLCAFLPVMGAVPALIVFNRTSKPTRTSITRVVAARYIATHTSPEDQVLIWGADPGVNLAVQRRSPTRFIYQYPCIRAATLIPHWIGRRIPG